MTTFADRLFELGGVPVGGAPPITGNVWFVDSGAADGADNVGNGYGRSPVKPFLTLDYAIGQCTASNGDVIYLLPGHAENLAAADTVDCDVAGVTIIGLGRGSLIPTFSTTAAAGSITVDAANVTIQNVKLVANFATGTTKGITITANGDGCTLDGVHFRDTAATSEFLIHISVATTVSDLWIKNCTFVTAAGGSLTNAILFAGTSVDAVIEHCYFYVDSADSVIDHATGASTNLYIHHCTIVNVDTGGALYCIQNKSDGTGVVHDCRLGYNKVDAEVSVGAATWWFENYATNTIAESGLLDPATSHAIP